jgi:hypothetical protein
VRATVIRAARRPPRRRCHFRAHAYPPVSLLLLNLSRRTRRPHLHSFPFTVQAPSSIASAAHSSPPAKHGSQWAATSKRSSPLALPLQASLTPTRAHRFPIVPQFRPELLTDERRPPPFRPHRGTLVSSSPRPRLSPSRASPPRPEANRPLPRPLRSPEYHPHRSTSPPAASSCHATTTSHPSSIPS